MNQLIIEQSGEVKRVTLNRLEKRNALNLELAGALNDIVRQSESDGTRLLVIRGEGKGFCAGFDFSTLEGASAGDLLLQFVRIEQMLQAIASASSLLRRIPAP